MTARKHEAPQITAMAGRVLRALARRAEEGDTEALEGLLQLQTQLSEAITAAGMGLHEFGYSFTELADVMGVSRQAARQRFTPVEKCPHGRRGVQACVPCHEASLTGDLLEQLAVAK